VLKRRGRARLYQIWPEASPSRRVDGHLPWRAALLTFLGVFGGAISAIIWQAPPDSKLGQIGIALKGSLPSVSSGAVATAADTSSSFGYCHTGGGWNCVVDGDTFWMEGVKIRVADIDAPETHPPRCSHEADLGDRATKRLHDLLNQGPFRLEALPDRDEDRYGRKLRIAIRDGYSLGDQLVSEGLARAWTGHRQPWC
jgi:micrococcal nuclease